MANDSGSNSNEGNIPIEDLRSIEAWVASARHYVVPTDDLRPRVLDSATGVSNSKIQERRIGYAIIAVAIIFLCWGGIWVGVSGVTKNAVNESASSISRRALELHDKSSINIHQATVDAYEEWRSRSQRSLPTSTSVSQDESAQPIVTPGSILAPYTPHSFNSTR